MLTRAQLVLLAAREVKLLGSLTPVDAHRERARLVAAIQAGREASPRWSYARVAHDDLRRALDAAERALAAEAETSCDRLYLGRLRELSLEAELCAAAGTAALPRLARERFASGDAAVTRQASLLCKSWLDEPAQAAPPETLASDDADPRSLLSRMRAEVGRLHLPFTIVTEASLASLAATGDGVILIAPARAPARCRSRSSAPEPPAAWTTRRGAPCCWRTARGSSVRDDAVSSQRATGPARRWPTARRSRTSRRRSRASMGSIRSRPSSSPSESSEGATAFVRGSGASECTSRPSCGSVRTWRRAPRTKPSSRRGRWPSRPRPR